MVKYSVLLVDDEPEIREGIIKKINWESYGFEIIGSAENGKEALEIAELKRPDVVMTDVMMPFMDGLELGEHLMKILPSTKLILFSGADEFEYAQKALAIRAVGYVLKPVDAMEMGVTLTKLKEKLDIEYENKRNLEKLRTHYIESIPVIREQFLVGLADGRIKSDQMVKQAGVGQVDLEAFGYSVGLLQIDSVSDEKNGELFKNHDTALLPTILRQVSEEIVPDYVKSCFFFYGNLVGILANLYEHKDVYRFVEGLELVCKEMDRLYGVVVTAGIGTPCESVSHIQYTRREAQTALTYQISVGSGQAIYLGDVEPEKKVELQFQGVDERELTSAIKMGNEDEIEARIDSMFDKLKAQTFTKEQMEVYFIEIKVSFMKLIQYYALNMDMQKEFAIEPPFVKMPETMEMAKKELLSKSLMLTKRILETRVNSRTAIAEQAKEYVMRHYSEDTLSVDVISQTLHISSNYFSSLFKKETNESFITYLTGVRMQKALELLDTTDAKSYVIAESVGYVDANYFSYVFKKYYGISPQRYRKRQIEEKSQG